jgi:hypothetical protein
MGVFRPPGETLAFGNRGSTICPAGTAVYYNSPKDSRILSAVASMTRSLR